MKNPWITKSSKQVYVNNWISVVHDEVTTPGGQAGIYGKVHYKNLAVGVIPLDDDNNTWLVGQYRYVLDTYSWEIPEGGCPEGTDPLLAAHRELMEETGIRATEWKEIMKLHTSNSVCDETAYLFVCRGLSFHEAEPEHTEELAVQKRPFAEVVEMVIRGDITDAMSVSAILKTDLLLKGGLL